MSKILSDFDSRSVHDYMEVEELPELDRDAFYMNDNTSILGFIENDFEIQSSDQPQNHE